MAKLKTLRPLVATMKPLIGVAVGDRAEWSRQRERNLGWRKWYHSTEWKKLRWRVLERDLFTCQMCGRLESATSNLVGDHKIPHRGDRAMFFDEANVWCLCAPCHNGAKAKLERAEGLR